MNQRPKRDPVPEPLVVSFRPQRHLRNNQVGDWFKDAYGVQHFEIALTGEYAYDVLILIHELVEQALCRARGVKESEVDDFDFAFRGAGEPGDDPKAPYRREHRFAEKVERMVCRELGIKWQTYSRHIDKVVLAGRK